MVVELLVVASKFGNETFESDCGGMFWLCVECFLKRFKKVLYFVVLWNILCSIFVGSMQKIVN